jgi:hypothetical protein
MSKEPHADRKQRLHRRIEIAFLLVLGPTLGFLLGLGSDWETQWHTTAIGTFFGMTYVMFALSGRPQPRK